MPGDEINLVPRVNNLGIDCYIRAKITYTVDDQELPVTDYINGNYSSWTKDGDYYYYVGELAPGESTTSLIQSVTFSYRVFQKCE